MEQLIEALNIFLKYGNPQWPTHCEHDVMYVDINYHTVSDEDKERLDMLGFFEDEENRGFMSYKYGSC